MVAVTVVVVLGWAVMLALVADVVAPWLVVAEVVVLGWAVVLLFDADVAPGLVVVSVLEVVLLVAGDVGTLSTVVCVVDTVVCPGVVCP